jgi:hypothetical protein
MTRDEARKVVARVMADWPQATQWPTDVIVEWVTRLLPYDQDSALAGLAEIESEGGTFPPSLPELTAAIERQPRIARLLSLISGFEARARYARDVLGDEERIARDEGMAALYRERMSGAS